MDLYNQILCRFQKYKRKVPPPSLPPFEKKNCRFLWKQIFFFQESFFSVIQAIVVQFFAYWKQKFFFPKDQKKIPEIFFLNLRVPGRVHEGSKNKFRNFFF